MTFIRPMLTKSSTRQRLEEGNWDGYVADLKIDGMRAVLVHTLSGVKLYSRTGHEYTDHVPHIVKEFAEKTPVGTVLDGELAYVINDVWFANRSVPLVSFNKTMRVMGSLPERARKLQEQDKLLRFLTFDMLARGDKDMTSAPYVHRRQSLFLDWADKGEHITPTPVWWGREDEPHYHELYDELVKLGVEGFIMKNESGLYVPGRRPNKNQYKVKAERTFDVVVMGFTDAVVSAEDKKGWSGLIGAIKFGAYDADGNLKYVGRCSGMNDEERKFWTDVRTQMEMTPIDPSRPEFVIEVKANDMVGSGEFQTPRHPQYVTKRMDKAAEECTMQQFRRQ